MANFLTFADRLKDLRLKMGMTQVKFAEFIGCTSTTLSAYENNLKRPSIDILMDIAERCTVSMDWLLGLSEVMDPGDKPRRYSDIIKMLLNIEEYIDIGIYTEWKGNTDPYNESPSYDPYLLAEITFGNQLMKEFIVEWEKMKRLHDDRTIDDDVYNLWIEKTLNKYNKELVGKGWEQRDENECKE